MSHSAQKRSFSYSVGSPVIFGFADALVEEEAVRHIQERIVREQKLHAGQGRVFTDEWNALVSDGTLIV